jgi:hypothetical protein
VSFDPLPVDLRRLKVHILRWPPAWRGPIEPWELTRGFRVEVLDRSLLWMALGGPESSDQRLLEAVKRPGEEGLLLLPAPSGPSEQDLQGTDKVLEGFPEADVLVLLSDGRRLASPRKQLSGLRARFKGRSLAVVWVWQDMPAELCDGLDFFNVEQNLHQLGRIGRRLVRQARWRRFLPWRS